MHAPDEAAAITAALRERAANLPHLPGVYRFLGAEGQWLYVGKAIDLRRRVMSYFQNRRLEERILRMVSQAVQLETTVTRSEAEALILEDNLIKRYAPRYNILFRDDKSYPLLQLRGKDFPRLVYFRGARGAHESFGPFPSASAARETSELLQRIFRLRNCQDSVFAHRTRACLLHGIGRCSAPCVGLISQHSYQADADAARRFLRGEQEDLLQALQAAMQQSAESEDFEAAARLRDQIAALTKVLGHQDMQVNSDCNADILAVFVQGNAACVNLAMVRQGRHLGDRAFFPQHGAEALALAAETAEDAEDEPVQRQVLERFLNDYYQSDAGHQPPPLLVLSHPVSAALEQALSERAQRHLQIATAPRGPRRAWLDMAAEGARRALAQRQDEGAVAERRTAALLKLLGITTEEPERFRVECFDVSHTSGEGAQASCVVFENHQMQSKQYRRFNIEGITGGDDLAAMRQVLQRHYSRRLQALTAHSAEPDTAPAPRLPDLVLIDGGRTQLNAARAVFEELGMEIARLAGIEKGEGRKVGREEIVFADGREKISPAAEDVGLLLLARIRDEAHRFAITGMRARRAKARTGASDLEAIEGIGPKRRAALLSRFGSSKALREASAADIAATGGISTRLAEEIYSALHSAAG